MKLFELIHKIAFKWQTYVPTEMHEALMKAADQAERIEAVVKALKEARGDVPFSGMMEPVEQALVAIHAKDAVNDDLIAAPGEQDANTNRTQG